MIQSNLLKKSIFALSTVAIVAVVGVVGAQAAGKGNQSLNGYTKDQCKDNDWKNFKNSNGSQIFKNQGDCVSFFATGGKNPPSGH